MTWIERGTPPGWAVSKLERNHKRPDRLWWARCVGASYYLRTEEDAHRVAWERWACSALGVVVWREGGGGDRLRPVPFRDIDASGGHPVVELWLDRRTEFGEDRIVVTADYGGSSLPVTIPCESVIDALVRLAGLKLALLPMDAD